MAEPKSTHEMDEEGSADATSGHGSGTHYEHIGRVIHRAIQDADHHALGRALHDAHLTFMGSEHEEPDGDEGGGGVKQNLAALLFTRKRH